MPVSSHLPARGGSPPNPAARTLSRFPVTSPRGEDHGHLWLVPEVDGFPVTSPRGEDQFGCAFNDGSKTFPVTSPRGEDLLPAPTTLAIIQVSSHPPPPRGEDLPLPCGVGIKHGVSSHLPARGGSPLRRLLSHAPRMFPVTSPRGEDPSDAGRVPPSHPVSSHLPARGGSALKNTVFVLMRQFPVTSPRGEDRVGELAEAQFKPEFPVTSPRGEDQPCPVV